MEKQYFDDTELNVIRLAGEDVISTSEARDGGGEEEIQE